jgi:hypothetical protein
VFHKVFFHGSTIYLPVRYCNKKMSILSNYVESSPLPVFSNTLPLSLHCNPGAE